MIKMKRIKCIATTLFTSHSYKLQVTAHKNTYSQESHTLKEEYLNRSKYLKTLTADMAVLY